MKVLFHFLNILVHGKCNNLTPDVVPFVSILQKIKSFKRSKNLYIENQQNDPKDCNRLNVLFVFLLQISIYGVIPMKK